MKFHKSIETIPIIQYYKLFNSKDYRYLLFLDKSELFELPKIEDKKLLQETFDNFFGDLTGIYDETQEHKISILKGFSKYLLDKNSMEYHLSFKKYLDYLDKKNLTYYEDGKSFKNVFLFYKYLKEKHGEEIYVKQIEIFFNLEFEEKEENFYLTIADIKKLGYPIDIFNDSYAIYLGIKKSIDNANIRNTEKVI